MSLLLKEGRREDLKKKYANKFKETDLDWILNISDLVDFNHKYSDFVLKNVDPNSQTFDEDVQTAVEIVKDFDKYQPNLKKRDINQYNNLWDLDLVLEPIKTKEKERELEKQVEKIYEDDKFIVIKPQTHQASCKYGANTKWCTTAQSDTHFKQYTSGSKALYYIINKANSTNKNYSKIAIHFDSGGTAKYWDSQDNPLSQREIDIVNYAFPEMIESINKDYEKISISAQDVFLKEVFNIDGLSKKTQNNFLGGEGSLMVTFEGFETINDLGPGHAQGKLEIILNKKIIDSYQVFITFKSIDKKVFSASIGFMGSDDFIETNDFTDLGLEGWGFDSKYLIGAGLPQNTAESIRNHIVGKVFDYVQDRPELQQKVIGSARVWKPGLRYGYTFAKNKGLIKKLIDYLDDGYDNGTKLDFLEYIGKIKSRVINGKKEYTHSNTEMFYPKSNWRGHFSSFFASAKNAGIIQYQKEGKDYIIKKGPNFEAFKKGELKAL